MGTTALSCKQANMYKAFSLLLLFGCISNVFCCDCDYHPGGCIISTAPKEGWKCVCEYQGFFTCSGHAQQCESGQTCPADCATRSCCLVGGGDCGGYSGGLGRPLPPQTQYPTPAPVQDYNPDIGQTNAGGYSVNKDPYCHKVEKVIFKNKCEPYKEKTCWTQNEEVCEPVMYKNCTGVIGTNIERVCFNVNELVCNLVEAVHYETLEETYQVQRCFTGKDRVCDTTYDIDTTTKDDYSAVIWRLLIATWRKKRSTMSPAPIQLSSTARGRRQQRTTDMDKRRLCVRGPRSRIAITILERSKSRYARPMSTGTAKSFPTSSPSQSRSRTATSSPRRFVSWR